MTMIRIYSSEKSFGDSDVFIFQTFRHEKSPSRPRIQAQLNFTGVSRAAWIEIFTVPTVSFLEQKIVTTKPKLLRPHFRKQQEDQLSSIPLPI